MARGSLVGPPGAPTSSRTPFDAVRDTRPRSALWTRPRVVGSSLLRSGAYVQCACDREVRLGSKEGPAEPEEARCILRGSSDDFPQPPLEIFHDPDHSELE